MSSHPPDPHADPGDSHAPDPHGAAHDDHAAHGGHDDHGAVEPPVEPERTPFSALIWPVLILLIVAILVLPMAAKAFAPYSAPPGEGGGAESAAPGGELTPVAVSTPSPIPPSTQTSGGPSEGTVIPQVPGAITAQPTNVTGPLTTPNSTPAPAAPTEPPTAAPTQAVAPLYNAGDDALRALTLGGQTYQVEATDTVADWKFSAQPGVASWVSGTIFPYVVGVPSSAANDTLLKSLKPNDQIRLTVASGTVRTFQVTSVQRVPSTEIAVLTQNHPGVALLLLGEAATDRLTVLGDFLPQS